MAPHSSSMFTAMILGSHLWEMTKCNAWFEVSREQTFMTDESDGLVTSAFSTAPNTLDTVGADSVTVALTPGRYRTCSLCLLTSLSHLHALSSQFAFSPSTRLSSSLSEGCPRASGSCFACEHREREEPGNVHPSETALT